MVQGLISRDTYPLIDGRCMTKAGATQNISYGTCEECRRKYSFFFGDIETYERMGNTSHIARMICLCYQRGG